MWICSTIGFFSVACAQRADGSLDPDTVMLRARRKAHLQNLQKRFPEIAGLEILVTPRNDYRYRLILPKAEWAGMLADLATEQEYSNFKDEAARNQSKTGADYVRALHEVWAVMHAIQK
jgi:hypothetical protein